MITWKKFRSLNAAQRFAVEGALLAACPRTGYFVIDRRRLPTERNRRIDKPFQLLSPDQEFCKLFRCPNAADTALQAVATFSSVPAEHVPAIVHLSSETNVALAS